MAFYNSCWPFVLLYFNITEFRMYCSIPGSIKYGHLSKTVQLINGRAGSHMMIYIIYSWSSKETQMQWGLSVFWKSEPGSPFFLRWLDSSSGRLRRIVHTCYSLLWEELSILITFLFIIHLGSKCWGQRITFRSQFLPPAWLGGQTQVIKREKHEDKQESFETVIVLTLTKRD